MGANTKIEWTDHTASPWHGCAKVHAGCDHCYAEAMSVRNPGTLGVWGESGVRVKSKSFISNLRKWNLQGEKEGRVISVFPSLCDPFEDRPELVPWRQEMFAVADECPWIRLLLLTKRPENVRRMWCSHVNTDGMPPSQLYRRNVWLGCSISDQPTADAMIPELLQLRGLCAGLFVSAEPLLGPVDFRRIQGSDGWAIDALRGVYSLHHDEGVDHPAALEEHDGGPKLDQVIVGGESGPHARPCNLSWVRLIRDQCKAAGVPCFVKQLGSRPIEGGDFAAKTGPVCSVQLHDKKGGDWDEWPEDLRVRELPEVKGPLLAEKNEGFT